MTAPTFPARLLPDPDELVCDYLRALLPDATVETQRSNPFGSTPYVFVHSTTSGTAPHWRLVRESYVDLDYYELGSRKACADLAERVRVALYTAANRGYTRPNGHLVGVEVTTAPYEQRLEGQGSDEYRFTSTYRLRMRTPRTGE